MQQSRIDSRYNATQCDIKNNTVWWTHIDGLVQERRVSNGVTTFLHKPIDVLVEVWSDFGLQKETRGLIQYEDAVL